jgi:hypothetical protein
VPGVTGDGVILLTLLITHTPMATIGSAKGPLKLRLPQLLSPTLNGGDGTTGHGDTLLTTGVTDTHTTLDGGRH